MKKVIATTMLVVAVGGSNAAPTYTEARKLTDSMQAVVNQTNLWDKLTQQQRVDQVKSAAQLSAQAERMFGSGSCSSAASSLQSYVLNLNQLTPVAQGQRAPSSTIELYGAMRLAFEFGDHYRSCKDKVELLDSTGRAARP